MKLTDVSETAILTLRCRAVESEKPNPIIQDPMARFCLGRLASLATTEERARFERRLPPGLTNHIAIRARKYDSIADDFISRNPSCTVVNLGCGFDTRYWRINNRKCRYIELDLPEVVELKREILKGRLEYEMIGCSVLDTSWIDKVTSRGNRDFLLIAEGLFMYLPRAGVISLFRTFSERFFHSQIALEVVTERYTRGIWKRIVEMKFSEFGSKAGSSYGFGLKSGAELETYGDGIKVVEEWSYFEDPDVKPWVYRCLGRLGFARTQWTIRANIN